jgi:small subunit ribosomal protein S19
MARRSKRRRKKLDIAGKKEFTYRGLSVDEMKALSLDEFLLHLTARKRRVFARGLSQRQHKLLEDVRNANKGDVVRTHLRDMVILPDFFGKTVAVYDGREFIKVDITPEKVGHYLGEFALTRKEVKHAGPGVGATRSSKYMPLK